ncbi:MAG: polysaccharide deacetylase family protein [Deltaproteobacteria bacterium]|nr:polysaccharide deacetylase family protein [Deltaproteobacteria bacterium]
MSAVHLTFDNGPHPEVTPRVLEVLGRHGVSATFFVLGQHLAEPWGMSLAHQIRDAGHRLGNHSFTHQTPLGEDPRPDAVALELARTQALLDQVWSGPRWFRPFGGGGVLGPHLLSPAAVEWLKTERMTCVLWTSVPGDWLDAAGWVDKALADAEAQPTDVVVLHDVLEEASLHLDRFLDALVARGHTFTAALPPACLPIVDGVTQPGLRSFVAS